MFLGSNCGLIRLYRGDKLDWRKCIFGNGTIFMVTSFKSTFKSPSKRIEQVKLLITFATMEFSFSKWFSFFFSLPDSSTDEPPCTAAAEPRASYWPLECWESTLLTISNKAWLSTGRTQSAWSISIFSASIALYGLVMTSSSLEGKTQVEKRKTPGY